MATIVLFHHIQGLTEGVVALADRFRLAGHDVITPDFFDGHTFESIEEGFAYRRSSGIDPDELADRAVADLPAGIVYAGISFGVMSAQRLAQTRPGALAALLFESTVPISGDDTFGPWPAGVPAQIHGMDADEFFYGDGDVKAAEEIVATVPGSELYLYPGDGHLFSDSSLPSFDAAATDLLVARVVDFLGRLEN